MRHVCLLLALSILVLPTSYSRELEDYPPVFNPKYGQMDKFRQLDEVLPTPNVYRTASGAPGSEYWQQQADYVIEVELDDENQTITGTETITYHNNSPDTLTYIWLQLETNLYTPDSIGAMTSSPPNLNSINFSGMRSLIERHTFQGGAAITSVRDSRNRDLEHSIVDTMMRVDLPKPLKPKQTFKFTVDWNYKINNHKHIWARTGYEYFEEDGNYLYEMAHWYPRMVAYTDEIGWQNKAFIGSGEFTLEFGDYDVRITVPDDHVVASTGVLQNAREVLDATQRARLEESKKSDDIVFIVTPEEAKANEKSQPKGKKTWHHKAKNVRDFAWASSRKFIWDAKQHMNHGNPVMAMSYYPNEGEPLWSRYSTHAIMHTLDVYSKYSFPYPYPVAISVNGPVGGMEYPMLCFNGPRPEEDGTYSKGTKYGLISVIIHEVGHNYFPMIVNSDERQWTWIDEGINSFLQYLSEVEWEDDYPSRRGEPTSMIRYMTSRNQVPIMTNSESIHQFGNNAYGKPAAALNLLRETVLGREQFDFAFKEFSTRWMFKRPTPADLFRTMEDASGTDLDWFWRGWFYTTDHVDIAITGLEHFEMETGGQEETKARKRKERDEEPTTLAQMHNEPLTKRVEVYPELLDFYNEFDALDVTEKDKEDFENFMKDLEDHEKELLEMDYQFYIARFKNIGGLVMPIILELEYTDGSTSEVRIPAEIWRYNAENVSKLLITTKEVAKVTVDPHLEIADADTSNNVFPPEIDKSYFSIRKNGKGGKNDMQRAKEAEEKAKKKAEEEAKAKEDESEDDGDSENE